MIVNIIDNEEVLKTIREIKPMEVFYQNKNFLYLLAIGGAISIKGGILGTYYPLNAFQTGSLFKIAKKVEVNIEL